MAKIKAVVVSDILREVEENSKKKVWIYNPDTEDFTVKYNDKPYTIMALESAEYPYYVANHIKKHLAKKLLYKRGIKTNFEDELKKVYKEIEMDI